MTVGQTSMHTRSLLVWTQSLACGGNIGEEASGPCNVWLKAPSSAPVFKLCGEQSAQVLRWVLAHLAVCDETRLRFVAHAQLSHCKPSAGVLNIAKVN